MVPDPTPFIMHYGYAALIPGVLLFGPLVSIAAGFLIRLGALGLIPTVAALAGAELMSDVVWYWLGRRFGSGFVKRFGRFVGLNEENVSHAKQVFRRNLEAIIFLSKLTAGFGFAPAIFFTAGLSHVPFGRYMAINLLGQVVWTTGLLAVGYFLGHLYLQIGSTVERVLTAGFIIILLACLLVVVRLRNSDVSARDRR